MAQRGRVRPTLKPMRGHSGFIFIPIEHTKPPCVVCGDSVGKGRSYTCSYSCKNEETIRVKNLRKRIREAKRPKISFPKRMEGVLGRLFG